MSKFKKGNKVLYKNEIYKVTADFGDDECMISKDDPKSDWAEELIAKDSDLKSVEVRDDDNPKKESINNTCPITLADVKKEVPVDMEPSEAYAKIRDILLRHDQPDDSETVTKYYYANKDVEINGLQYTENKMEVNFKSFKEATSKKEAVASSEEEILQQVRRVIQEKGLLNTNISKDGDGSYYITNNPDGGIPNGFLANTIQEFESLYPEQFEFEGVDFDNHIYFRIHISK